MNIRKYVLFALFALLLVGGHMAPAQASAKIADTATESAISEQKNNPATEKNYTNADLKLMASIINCEAGGESYQGKLAVGIVIMNRISSRVFPNTLHKVIYQRRQFTPVRNGMLKKKLAEYSAGHIHSEQWQDCIRAAKAVMDGQQDILYHGKKKSLKGYHFFSVYLSGARFRLGGHRFK